MIRRRLYKSTLGVLCAALMIAGTAGCEKKAETITDAEDRTEAAVQDSAGKGEEKTTESGTRDSKPADAETWAETYTFDGEPFNEVKVSVKVRDYSQEPVSVVKTETRDYDREFMKEMCDNVFDGEPEVFDYSVRTKKICDADIEMYTDVKKVLEDEKSVVRELYIGSADSVDPDRDYAKELGDELDKRLADLETEKNSAPESVENDYSYGGYLGDIGGEEFVMCFGNRLHSEYVEAPFGYAVDGRICTIYRKNIREVFGGIAGTIGEIDAYNFSNAEFSEEKLAEAEAFVQSIGFGDYVYTGEEPTNYYHMHGYDISFFAYNGLPAVAQYQTSEGDMGTVFTFVPGGGTGRVITQGDIWFELYSEDHNTMNVNTYIKVYVSDEGVIACQIVNPMKVTSVEADAKIISASDAKDIIIENIDNADAWNMLADNKPVSVELTKLRLINFPVRSTENKNEYTYVPAYLFYGSEYDPMNEGQKVGYSMPCMIINALDGSFIKVEGNLTDPFKGYARGNEGYDNLMNGTWENHKSVLADLGDEGIVEQNDNTEESSEE